MNLNTHSLFAAAVAAFLVGKPEAILLAGLGSIVPDLDRPYWFIPKKKTEEEEYHRAFLHNIVALAATYLINPYLGLGLFSHLLLDSMTTVKDRGVEWLFPFTRLIPEDYWSQAEVQQEPLAWVPWRRTYGPALNGHMLDTYVSLSSIGVIVSWMILQSLYFSIFNTLYWLNSGFLILSSLILVLFASGEYVQAWPKWSGIKRTIAIVFLVLVLSGMSLMAALLFQNPFFAWKTIPIESLLRASEFFYRVFLVSTVAYVLVILKFIRRIATTLADKIPALCTRMPSRDFFIEEKTNEPDVFV